MELQTTYVFSMLVEPNDGSAPSILKGVLSADDALDAMRILTEQCDERDCIIKYIELGEVTENFFNDEEEEGRLLN